MPATASALSRGGTDHVRLMAIDDLRDLPQVEVLAARFDGEAPRSVVRTEVRRVLDAARTRVMSGQPVEEPELVVDVVDGLNRRRPMTDVINATGVLLHTNLGRAPVDPLDPSMAGLGPVPIEMALGSGRRQGRLAALEADLCELTGAESALVVNNNAGALLVALSALARGGEVVVSRGQLVEIGGSFRIPDIVTQGGAILREVGTTNRTYLRDFEAAITDATSVLLQVHPSNFVQTGFTATVPTEELAALARDRQLAMVHDIGSGLVDARVPWLARGLPSWLRDEPAARQVLEAGAHIVTFSGDKLLGGPQAGVICGDGALVSRIREHPLARALRFDKIRAAHLHAVVRAHLDGSAQTAVPFWRMACASSSELLTRARLACELLRAAGVPAEPVATADVVGAGAAPGTTIEGSGIEIAGSFSADGLVAALRRSSPPVVALTRSDRVVLSLRTVSPTDDPQMVAATIAAATGRSSSTMANGPS